MGSPKSLAVVSVCAVIAMIAIVAPVQGAARQDGLAAAGRQSAVQNGHGSTSRWLGADGKPILFASEAHLVDFLREAEVISVEPIPVGVTKPRKVLLERDGVRAHAIFRDVDITKERTRLDNGNFHMRLRDYALFEVAAYRLAGLLGLDNVPPAVVRVIEGEKGSLQLWVENAMTERDRRQQRRRPPHGRRWIEQMQTMFLFDHLIANVDRHPGNYLMDARGYLWMIDHTRAFQMFVDDSSAELIGVCWRPVWERLELLDEETLRATLSGLLDPFEIGALYERIERFVAHINRQIAARGESAVIIDSATATLASAS